MIHFESYKKGKIFLFFFFYVSSKAVAINNKILPWYNDSVQLPKYEERKGFMTIKNNDTSSLVQNNH